MELVEHSYSRLVISTGPSISSHVPNSVASECLSLWLVLFCTKYPLDWETRIGVNVHCDNLSNHASNIYRPGFYPGVDETNLNVKNISISSLPDQSLVSLEFSDVTAL